MKFKSCNQRRRFCSLLVAILWALAWAGTGYGASQVTVYYFHSTARCAECLNIEEMAEATLRGNFAAELAGGRLSWRSINADLPEHSHYVFDYELAANELVVATDSPPENGGWKKLAEVWTLAHDPETFRSRLVPLVEEALNATEQQHERRAQ